VSTGRFGLDFADKAEALRAVHLRPSSKIVADSAASVRFDEAEHVFIEGDNLEALRLLVAPYHRRVQAIYVDPPYNTGRDFVYRDRWGEGVREHLRRTGQVDERGTALVPNPTTDGRHHSAWLAMMLPRLALGRELLRDDGLLFVSIDDHEVHRLRMLLDEIFGEDCFIAQIVVVSNRGGRDYLRIATGHEYLLVYGATPEAPVRELPNPSARRPHHDDRGAFALRDLRNRNPRFHPDNRPNLFYPILVAPGRADEDGLCPVSLEARTGYDVTIEPHNSEGRGSVWRWGREKLRAAIVDDDPASSEVVARRKRDGSFGIYEKHRKTTTKPRSLWDATTMRSEAGTIALRERLGAALFDHPKPVELVRRCIRIGTDPDAIVMDFFAGSGTTAEAVLEENRADGGRRRFLLVQLAEVLPERAVARGVGHETVADIARARIRAALRPDEGVRCFRLARDESIDWTPPATTDPAVYLEALRARERRIAERTLEPWDVGVRLGMPLDARVRRLDQRATTSLWDEARGRELVVSDRASLSVAEVARWDLGEGAELVCHDHALDDAAALELATRHRLSRW
jgi:adenine-specific DNA-methyltransferase